MCRLHFPKYKKSLGKLGLTDSLNTYPLLDTLVYIDTFFTRKYLFFGPFNDTTIVNRGTFIYNESLNIYPYLMDRQNFLEIYDPTKGTDNGWYREYYIERSYRRLLDLEVYESITPHIEVDPAKPLGSFLQMTYHLTPAKKQIFSLEPRATNSNGYLGVSASVNYTNKNTLGGAEKLKLSFSGGLESQPAVFDNTDEEQNFSDRALNTFEINPKNPHIIHSLYFFICNLRQYLTRNILIL